MHESSKQNLEEIGAISLADLVDRRAELLAELAVNGEEQGRLFTALREGGVSYKYYSLTSDLLVQGEQRLGADIKQIDRVIRLMAEQGIRAIEEHLGASISDSRNPE